MLYRLTAANLAARLDAIRTSRLAGSRAVNVRPHSLRFMSQVKIFGLRERLDPIKRQLSDVIHSCLVEALQYPADKRAHRFFPLDRSDFFYPPGRSERYTIIEFSMFEGRSVEAKKRLIRLLFERVEKECGISPRTWK